MHRIDFEYTQEQLKTTASKVLDRALKLGATSAQLEIHESIETSIDILNNAIENFETNYSNSLSISVYIEHNRGCVTISTIQSNAIEEAISRALDIAKHTQSDIHNGIAQKNLLCKSFTDNLSLFNPIHISNTDLINTAKNIEKLSLNQNPAIKISEGSNVTVGQYNFVIANTNGLNLGYQTSRYSKSISLIGKNQYGMQTDYWYDSSRDYNNLISDELLAKTAVARTARRLNKGQIKAGKYKVIFEASIAKSLISNFLEAISGSNLFRRLSFLNDSLGQKVFPTWVTIQEDPFIIKGSASCYFDNEGVCVSKRELVKEGAVNGYLLNSYTARKLGMESTGNSGGNHNILVKPNFHGDINKLSETLENGLIIIETIGHGVNLVSGNYSVGASALLVEDKQIKTFIDNITISGNLLQIYQNIQYISDDYSHNSSIMCGSILVDGINVAT